MALQTDTTEQTRRTASKKRQRKVNKKKRRKVSKKRRKELDAQREASTQYDNPDAVMTFLQWCRLNNISPATGKRILSGDSGPTVTWLSTRRRGVSVRHDREWKERCASAA
jgi:hypothetical protein